MKRQKRALTFKKIKIANMNFIKGGGNEDISIILVCITQNRELACAYPVPVPASDPDNPCSDGCNISNLQPCTAASIGSFFCETTSI
ncbi:hypothetical protein [Kordia jejudonensis]|uniref:hypothetical protein n=1 Tax=Kordia jejudonensis TaxID=1348245 RepID=UPI0006295BF2|nr:hypothetical protein [Kordia jejudonensis]